MEIGSNRIVAAVRALAVAGALALATPGQAALVASIAGDATVAQGSTVPLLLDVVLEDGVELSSLDLIVLALPGFSVTSIAAGGLLLPAAELPDPADLPVCPSALPDGPCWEFGSVPGAGAAFASLFPLTLDSAPLLPGTLFHVALDVSAAEAGSYTLQMLLNAGPTGESLCGPEEASLCEKQITVAPVPEPSSWALLLAGFTLLGARLLRRIG